MSADAEIIEILSTHWRESRGLSYNTADTCACGERVMPEPGDEDPTIRRARAFAGHQTKMLSSLLYRLENPASAYKMMLSDLDRSAVGRHRGDAELQDATGTSQGNPHLKPGQVIGYNIYGRPYIVPEDGLSNIENWITPREGL